MSALAIALLNAATNCERNGATAVLVLRSGREIEGKLERWQSGATTAHVKGKHGGWSTALIEEVAAVIAVPPSGHRSTEG
jgi:hypothetical protein